VKGVVHFRALALSPKAGFLPFEASFSLEQGDKHFSNCQQQVMKMTAKERKAFQDWLTKKNVNPTCQACGKQDWQFSDTLRVVVYKPGEILSLKVGESRSIAAKDLRPMICNICGYVMLFDIPPLKSPSAKPKPPESSS
jgi:hypothetical protein